MRRVLRILLKALGLLALLVALILGVAALRVRASTKSAQAAWPRAGQLVTVAGGQRLHVADTGQQTPGRHVVVLLHGNAGSMHDFDRLVPELARTSRVIVVDRPGHGYSERASMEQSTPSAQARAIRAALTQLGVERPILVGHSWGGALALAYALDFPADVAGLVLVGTRAYPYEGPPDPLYALLRTPVIGPALRHSIVPMFAGGPIERRVVAAYRPDPVDSTHLARSRALWSRPTQLGATVWDTELLQRAAHTMSRRYSTLPHPTMLVVGDGDELRPETERLSREMPGSWIRVLPNTGHYAIRTRPADVARAVAELEARLAALQARP
jgi:pimeloyl-ACP methyl ester carboxylesterase